MKLRNSLLGAVVLLVLLTSLLLSGCSSSSTESKSSGSALQVASLSANPPSVTIGNTSIIEAVVSDGTTPLANRIATFTVTPSGAGTFTPAVDTSGSDGIVASIFTPTQTGTVSIRATVSGTVSRTVALSITSTQPSGSGSIRLVATPTRLIADGESTSQITITARDYDSHLAPDSTIIILTAGEKFVDLDSNGYFTSGIDSIVFDAIPNGQWDPIGNIPSTAMVDGGLGRAVATYTAGLEAVTTYIRATCITPGLVGYAETQIELTPNTSIASITLMANNIHLAVKATGGIETAQLYATGYDPNGNQVPEGLPISFIITNGPGGGEHLGTTGYGPYIATTNARGMAYCPIASGTISGTIRIRAYVDTILSNATPIMVHAGPPSEITIGAEELNVQDWGKINERVGITAIVSDIYHNPVGDSVVVYFTCDEGTILAHEARTSGEEGIATSTWISGYDASGADGIVEVYAETNGGTLADTTYFLNSWLPNHLWFVGFPGSIPADGITIARFYLEVRDLNDNFVIDGTNITFEANYLITHSGVVHDGVNASVVRSSVTSVVLDYDHSLTGVDDDGIGAIDAVWASYQGFIGASMACTLLTGPAYTANCAITLGTTTVPRGIEVPFSVTIKDRSGNRLGDHTLVASISSGSVSNEIQMTDMYGEASGFSLTAPTDTSIATVILQVHDTDPRGGISLSKQITPAR